MNKEGFFLTYYDEDFVSRNKSNNSITPPKPRGIFKYKTLSGNPISDSILQISSNNLLTQSQEQDGTWIAYYEKPINVLPTISDNQDLSAIWIPDEYIYDNHFGRFSHCKNLNYVKLSNNQPLLMGYIFYKCSSLTHIDLPESIARVGEYSLYKTGIKSITIPKNVTRIGSCALPTNMESIIFKPLNPPTYEFSGDPLINSPNTKVYVPAASVQAYLDSKQYGTNIYPIE